MMTSISGELGTGKTFYLARECYRQAMAGCYIATNFNHVYANKVMQNNSDEILEFIRQVAVLKQMGGDLCDILPSFNHTGMFIAIDEAHLVFGRESSKKDMEDVILPFVSLARKQDVRIMYTVQDYATIHKTFRRYTEKSVHMRPLVPLFKTVYVPHESRPTWRRERRLMIPFVWEETHRLDPNNPILNYRRKHIEDGGTVWHESSTVVSRRIRKNSDRFIHSLYDSNELSGVNIDLEKEETFDKLKGAHYIPKTYHKDYFPTFRRALLAVGLNVGEIYVPPRVTISNWEMPLPEKNIRKSPKLVQKEETMDAEQLINKTYPDKKMAQLKSPDKKKNRQDKIIKKHKMAKNSLFTTRELSND